MTKEEIVAKLELAAAYVKDAAPHSAIRVLDEAREVLAGWAATQDRILAELGVK